MTIKTEITDSFIVAKKEFKILSRKKALLIPLVLFPIVMIIFFGYGMGGTVKNAPILIVSSDTGIASSSLVQEIGNYTAKYNGNPMFSVTYTKDMSQSEAESKINAGMYKGILMIPSDYSDRVAKNESTTLTLLTDSADTTTSGLIISFMRQVVAKTGSIILNIPNIYGHLEFLDFLTPGVIALTVFMGSVATTGSAIAGEKEDGTLVRMLMTPVSKRSIILGKTIYQLILQIGRAVVLIIAAYLLLGFNMNGSWLLFSLVLVIFTLGGVGMGIIMSAGVEDYESFMQINMLVTMPSMFVTGVFFPLSSAPNWMQYIAYCLPLTYAIDALRIIMIKGQGLSAISHDLIILSLFAVITFTAGVRLFRREA
ncbi:MAG TPA: ABC transporter permease [Bacteroidales bacterium]